MKNHKKADPQRIASNSKAIKNAGVVVNENIVSVIEKNYMPYAMSVIMSRAIPEIDGFKPSQRKLLYTMYMMGLLHHSRTKSANIVGQTMKLNPHGDSAIYETMARMSRGFEALSHPFVDSKGNFGKFYSRDMACAASRYTEAKLEPICEEIFGDIEKNTVDFAPNYDNTLKEPVLLPVNFPSILVNISSGIAVGMASSICPFNLKEVCSATVKLIEYPDSDISKIIAAPDFVGGGEIIFEKSVFESIYSTGRGTFRVRARYFYDESSNCIDIINIPPTTTSEAIIEKLALLVKQNKINEISDIRDETGLEGLKITIDLKRGTDHKKLMSKLFRLTPLEDSFSCNFNILINGSPVVLGVKRIILEWIDFRTKAVRRRLDFDLCKKKDKLHLLLGLSKIILDIDRAIEIIRNTEEESLVLPNLMVAFSLDILQAEFVAEIKLRNINKEYIVKKTAEISELEYDVKKIEKILESNSGIRKIIIKELESISKRFGKPRVCSVVQKGDLTYFEPCEENFPDYPVIYFFTSEGYFKKITPQSLRMSSEQKLKNGDEIIQATEGTNNSEIIFFTNSSQAYKAKGSLFPSIKASSMGEFIHAKLEGNDDEKFIYMAVTRDYSGFMTFFYSNGKVAKVQMSAYQTKTNRKKLIRAYNQESELKACFYIRRDENFVVFSSSGRALFFNTSLLSTKSKRDSQGVLVMRQMHRHKVTEVKLCTSADSRTNEKYFEKILPSSGKKILRPEIVGNQLKF
ncbi:MAG: topoisomerase IV [Oscillospiraceae bacterium]|jgi:DNA gyrase subunit A|nr:topoisomerase IV [Oscillospiraceae bacterium]